MGGGYDDVLDDILSGVMNKGYGDSNLEVLLNTCFREETGTPSFWDQVQNWSSQHHLTHERLDLSGDGKSTLRFRKKIFEE